MSETAVSQPPKSIATKVGEAVLNPLGYKAYERARQEGYNPLHAVVEGLTQAILPATYNMLNITEAAPKTATPVKLTLLTLGAAADVGMAALLALSATNVIPDARFMDLHMKLAGSELPSVAVNLGARYLYNAIETIPNLVKRLPK